MLMAAASAGRATQEGGDLNAYGNDCQESDDGGESLHPGPRRARHATTFQER